MISFSQARDRFVSYYFKVAEETKNLKQDVVEQELPNISQTFRFISQQHDPKLSHSFWEAISGFLWDKYYWHLYQDWGTKILEIVSGRSSFILQEAWLCSEQGWITMEWGDYDLALRMFSRSEQLFRNIDPPDYRGLCIILRYLGVLNYRRRNFVLSIEYLNGAKEIAIQHKFDVMLSEIYNLQASIARKEGNLENALILYSQSIEILEKIGDSRHIPPAMRNLAKLKIELGNFDEAKSDLLNAIQICEHDKNFNILYSCQLALAELEFQMGNLEAASQMARNAKNGFISLSIDNASERATTLIERINEQLKSND